MKISFLLFASLCWGLSSETRIAVIKPNKVATVPVGVSKAVPFSATMGQIHEVEDKLGGYLKTTQPKLSQKWPYYYRQYLGIQTVGGARKIKANFLCRVNGDVWKTDWIMVLDGGDCYFNFSYNLDKHEIGEFTVNREA